MCVQDSDLLSKKSVSESSAEVHQAASRAKDVRLGRMTCSLKPDLSSEQQPLRRCKMIPSKHSDYCIEQVNRARAKLVCFCHPDKACLPKNSFVTKLEGVGALTGPQAWEVCLPCYLQLISQQVVFALVAQCCFL